MLHFLKQKNANVQKIKLPFIGAFAKSLSFDPLTLPNYQAGYTMNFTTDVIPGSINPILINSQWFDANVLGIGSKLLQRGNAVVTGLVNGFNCMHINDGNAPLQNPTIDIMTGVNDFSFVIGFKRPAATLAYHILFSIRSANTPPFTDFYIYTNNTNNLKVDGVSQTPGVNIISATSVLNNYNDNAWHVAVVNIDQTNKTISITTELESFSGSNPLFVPHVMTPDSQGDFQIGGWLVSPANNWSPGFVGDVIVLNSLSDLALTTELMTWEKTRLGI